MFRKKRKNYLILFIIILLCISVGYSILSRNLNIMGNSEIKQNSWNIYFDNLEVTPGSVEAENAPVIDNSKLSVDFDFLLNLPGDFYEFTVDIVNAGSIDAMIDSISKTSELTEEQKKYLDYVIEYQNGEEIKSNQLVKSNSSVRIKVRVEYKRDITAVDLPTSEDSLNLGFHINYVQANNLGVVVNNNGRENVAKSNDSIDKIGTIVTIGTEQFYVIGTEGDNVKLLSMYNLYVGNTVDESSKITSIKNPTGMQSVNAKGYIDEYPYVGTVKSSDSSFTILTYEKTLLKEYVDNYKGEIEKLGVNVVEARLITLEELIDESIGCVESTGSCTGSPYSWIYSTTYWTGSNKSFGLYTVNYSGKLSSSSYRNESYYGIRPVIIVPKSEVSLDFNPVANGDINEIGTIVTIGSEQFYTIGTEGNDVKLLSMYALNVGGELNEETDVYTEYTNATGMQDKTMTSYEISEYFYLNKGVVEFSNDIQKGEKYTDYNGSIVEGHVNNYKYLLESKFGLIVSNARIINEDELLDMKCSKVYCAAAAKWTYSLSYWVLNTTGDPNYLVHVSHFTGIVSNSIYTGYYNVRPLIFISKDYFS